VFLSPKFCESARQHIFKLIAKHGGVEELVSVDPVSSGADNGLSRVRDSRTPTLKPYDTLDFKRQLAELHLVALNRAKSANSVCMDLLFYLASLKFQRSELLNQYNLVLERCRARMKQHEGPRQIATGRTLELRERFVQLQINKKAVLRRAGQD